MKRIAMPLLSISLLLSGCQNTDAASSSSTPASADTEPVSVIDTSALFSDRDLDGSYDESAAIPIQLTERPLPALPTLSPLTAPGLPCWTRGPIWCPVP